MTPHPKKKRIKATKAEWERLRRELARRANNRCERCDTYLSYGHGAPHHIISKGAGGDDTLDNLEYLCAQCHNDHHDGR